MYYYFFIQNIEDKLIRRGLIWTVYPVSIHGCGQGHGLAQHFGLIPAIELKICVDPEIPF